MCRKLICLMSLALLLSLSFAVESAESANIRKGPYPLYPGNNTQMTVLWQLRSTTSCTLEWGLDTTYSSGNTVTTEYGTDHQHKYTITGLTPGSKYYYRVIAGSESATGSFRAAPGASATNVKILAYGDTRSQPDIHDGIDAAVFSTYQADPNYQTLILHSGDWVGDNSESTWAVEWFDSNQMSSHKVQADVPFAGCMGNHEGTGTVFAKYFPSPYVAEHYWSFDYGPVHVAIVDQYTSYNPGSAQYTWLENDLATTNKEWVFIVFHEPGYSAGGCHNNSTAVQNYIQPLCVNYGVDIVFTGHNHYYARTTVERVKHITVGTAGAPLCTSGDANEVEFYEAEYHFCKIDIYGTQLGFTAVDSYGAVIDTFMISHGPIVDDLAVAETTVAGTPTGRYPRTHTSNNVYESITEVLSGGSPAKRYSYLEHKWTIDVIGGADTVTFNVEAYRTANSEGDDFVLAYSTDDVTYTNMVTVTKTSDNDTYQSYSMPNDVNGNVYVRVKDADRTAGRQALDTIYVDHMYIQSAVGAPDTTPPTPNPMTWATKPYSTGSTSIAMVATTASDPSGVEYYFDETSGNPGSSDSGWQAGTSYTDTGLSPSTTYTYRVQARDKSANKNATGWSTSESATTQPGPGGTVIFSDGFESGNFTAGGWTISGSTATVTTAAKYTGSYGAKLGKLSWIEKAVSTSGYTGIYVKYARKAYGLDPGEEFKAQWYDGTTWYVLESTLDTNWAVKELSCGAGASNNPNFRIRFSSSGGHPSAEYSYLDDIQVSGTP